MASYLLKEDAEYLLLETGDKIVLEDVSSPSSSVSPSASISPSSSVSSSVSPSSSASPSSSRSPSSSISPSSSSSPSSSISASPSPGYSLYSRQESTSLPTNDNDLSTLYTDEEEEKVLTDDHVGVGQVGTDRYMIHQFKEFVGSAQLATIEWEGKSTLAPTESVIYLQIYNHNLDSWETLDSQAVGSVDVNLVLEKTLRSLTAYKDASSVISCRVYQLAI